MAGMDVEYEQQGWFDKDQQGWCADRVHIQQVGDRVSIRRWHDANGHTEADSTVWARVGERVGNRVMLMLEGGGTLAFDLETGRLV